MPDAPRPVDERHVDADGLIQLFTSLADEVGDALRRLDDWSPSGAKPGQYTHDVVADDIVLGGLTAAGLAVLSEESGVVGSGAVTVVVDPVDGSTNGSRGLPWFASSFCAVDEEGLWAALVRDLAGGHTFTAVRGQGWQWQGPDWPRRSGRPSDCRSLDSALVSFSGLPRSHGGWRQFRTYGAAALDMCAVATGSFDGFVDTDCAHGVWDYLGAMLVCQEAGAVVADGDGQPLLTLDHNERRAPIAASTPELLDQLVAMRRSWKQPA